MGGYMGSMNYEDLWSTTRSPASGSGFHECNEVIQLKGSCMGCGVLYVYRIIGCLYTYIYTYTFLCKYMSIYRLARSSSYCKDFRNM